MNIPIRTFARLLLTILVFATVQTAFAKTQDPFAVGEAEPDDVPRNVASKGSDRAASLDPNERSAVVLSVRSNPPRTVSELARAIQLMSRIRRWDEVGHWLDEAVKLGLNEANATKMVQTAGTQTFLQLISLDAGLSDLRRSNAKKILELASSAANNPKKLVASVSALGSLNKTERIQAFRALESAGNRGVAALINFMLAEGSAAPSPTMCEAFTLMGKPAFAAWQAAINSPHADARGRLALLAARSGEPSLMTDLCVAAIDQRIDQGVRNELAMIAANRNKSIPTGQEVYRHALDRMQKSLKAFQTIRWMDEPDAFTSWQLSTDGRAVQELSARLADLDWIRAAQFAHSAMQCGEFADSSSGLAVAVLCENASRLSPEAANKLTLADVVPSLPAAIVDSYEFGCLVWDASVSSNLASAQLTAIRNLGRWASAATIPNAVRERLSKACSSGFAAVRYSAAQALLGTMYLHAEDGSVQLSDVHFDGRHQLEKVLSEMRMLEGSPLTLVVGGAEDLRTHTRTLLEAFGFRVLEAASASQAMSYLRAGQPIEAVFVVSHVLEMNLGELAQRVRTNPTTATCPIAILAASLSRGEHEIAGGDPRVVMGSVPPEQAGFADILRRISIVSQSPLLDSANRNTWRELSSTYWLDQQNKFVSAQPKAIQATAVDTPVGQMQLIQYSIDDSKTLPKREQASQKFVQSVKQFGVLISSEAVKALYDEYNKRGPSEMDLRIVLGRILDAIEAAKGNRLWAEVAP